MAKSKKKKVVAAKDAETMVCQNRRAKRNFDIGSKYEAGLVLRGSEVKSCRAGKAHLNEAYVDMKGGEAFLVNAHIAEYPQASLLNHTPSRQRKLLLQRKELDVLDRQVTQKGMTLVPLTLYFKRGRVKLRFALGKGRGFADKREYIKERDTDLEMRRALRRRSR